MRQWTAMRVTFPPRILARVGHTAVLGRDGQTIYYFGGLNAETEERDGGSEGDFSPGPMNIIMTFSTTSRTWQTLNSSGSVIPSPRSFHTTNLSKLSVASQENRRHTF